MAIDPTHPARAATRVPRPQRARRAPVPPVLEGAPHKEDSAAVLGIPAAELTPRVRDGIMRLMAEVDRLRRDLDEARSRIAQLEELADRDPLVPVLNRRAFVRELSRITSFAARYDVEAAMAYFDLDGFKAINDSLGHAAGDAALKAVAATLTAHVRASDAVGRLGGDEFAVILARATAAQAEAKAAELAAAIAATPVEHEGRRFFVKVSTGTYSFERGEDPGTALARADAAMYARKRAARSS